MAKILIVDDSKTQLEHMKNMVEQLGCQTLCAEDGDKAILLAQKELPDLILMDVIMPFNGFQATRMIRHHNETQNIPILFLTSKQELSDKIWGLKQGAQEYLIKPIDKQTLSLYIQKYIK